MVFFKVFYIPVTFTLSISQVAPAALVEVYLKAIKTVLFPAPVKPKLVKLIGGVLCHK